MLIDGDGATKWFDSGFTAEHSSTVVLTLASPAEVHTYMLITAKDVSKRTPTDWTLSVIRDDGSAELLSEVHHVALSKDRQHKP